MRTSAELSDWSTPNCQFPKSLCGPIKYCGKKEALSPERMGLQCSGLFRLIVLICFYTFGFEPELPSGNAEP